VSDVIGTKIVDAFTFGQRSTDVRRLLERSLERLSAARENRRGSSTDLWQLEIIISDGICQDLDDLRALLRKATEQKVMVVFVVVDSLHQQPQSVAKDNTAGAAIQKKRNTNSILSMNSVSYVRGKDGNLELQMERYMDAFPFDYYVVLRDVESLPDVLSETLRQFFERVSVKSLPSLHLGGTLH
jgi:midasin